MAYKKSIGIKMNDPDVCLDVVLDRLIGMHRPVPR